MSRQNQRTNFVMTNFCFLCCIRTKNVEAVKKLSNSPMVVFTTYDRQVYHGFVYLVDFPKLLPGRILSAVRLKNLSASKNCRVTTNHPHLSSVGNDRKFVHINNFVASADRPIVTYKKGNVRQLKDDSRVSLSTGTSRPNRHTHDLTVEDGDIFNNNYSPVFKCQFRIRMTRMK